MGASNEGAEWMRLFWLVFERTSNPIVLLDGERRIDDLNGAALALLGVEDKDELVGKVIDESISPAEREQAVRDWESSVHSGEYTGKRVLLRADGTEVPVDFAARLADIGARRLTIYVVAAHDATYKPSARLADSLPLRSREREVVTLIALGLDTDEIAERLYISPSTVRTHVRNAMARLGAHTRAQLVAKVLCAEKGIHPAQLAG
ncbi:MAG TPA: LuxR C-terminal-related transcriptional regulator [Solirubrobacteraceae bacterium]|nr:LuxR C-terminal-related transcriptional regulator [Solirubrobacteraceae bacterium]